MDMGPVTQADLAREGPSRYRATGELKTQEMESQALLVCGPGQVIRPPLGGAGGREKGAGVRTRQREIRSMALENTPLSPKAHGKPGLCSLEGESPPGTTAWDPTCHLPPQPRSSPALVGHWPAFLHLATRSSVKSEKNQLRLAILSPAMAECSREEKKKYL